MEAHTELQARRYELHQFCNGGTELQPELIRQVADLPSLRSDCVVHFPPITRRHWRAQACMQARPVTLDLQYQNYTACNSVPWQNMQALVTLCGGVAKQ